MVKQKNIQLILTNCHQKNADFYISDFSYFSEKGVVRNNDVGQVCLKSHCLYLFYKNRDKNFSFQVFFSFLVINYSVVGINNENYVKRGVTLFYNIIT